MESSRSHLCVLTTRSGTTKTRCYPNILKFLMLPAYFPCLKSVTDLPPYTNNEVVSFLLVVLGLFNNLSRGRVT